MNEINTFDKIPEKVVIPLKQHLGAACESTVKAGDSVLVGQKIGECPSYIAATVHSTYSGEVLSVEDAPNPDGNKVTSVVIQPVEEQVSVQYSPKKKASASELLSTIKDAGIVEFYGAPTHAILKPEGKKIDMVLINALSSEWVHGDFKSPEEYASEIFEALKLMMKASGAQKGAIVLRNDDNESINAFEGLDHIVVGKILGKRKVDYYFEDLGTDAIVVSHKPMRGKRILDLFTYSVTGRKVPLGSGPTDVGVSICSVKSAKAIYDAVYDGKPQMETAISVSGAVNNPQKISVKVGTLIKDVIDACGGYKGDVGKVIVNGSLTGVAQYSDEVPVTKTTSSITVQTKGEVVRDESTYCIHCARCVDVCPVDLIPSRIAALANLGRYDECKEMHVMNCIECGRCSAVCPAKIHLLQLNRYAKVALEKAYSDLAEKKTSNLELGCCGGA